MPLKNYTAASEYRQKTLQTLYLIKGWNLHIRKILQQMVIIFQTFLKMVEINKNILKLWKLIKHAHIKMNATQYESIQNSMIWSIKLNEPSPIATPYNFLSVCKNKLFWKSLKRSYKIHKQVYRKHWGKIKTRIKVYT